MPDSDMQPRPMAETDRPPLPRARCSSFGCVAIGCASGVGFPTIMGGRGAERQSTRLRRGRVYGRRRRFCGRVVCMTVIGVDFGTTNSVVTRLRPDGSVETVRHAFGVAE